MRRFSVTLCALWLGLSLTPAAAQQTPQAQVTQCVSNALAGGSANAITIPLQPCGLATNILLLTVSSANTGPVTMQMVGFPVQPLVNSGGQALVGGQLAAGAVVTLTSTGTKWLLLSNGAQSTTNLAQSVSNIQALQALGPSSALYATVTVAGFYVPGDLGGGTFAWINGSLCNAVTGGGDLGQTFCAFLGSNPSSGYVTSGFWRRLTNGAHLSAVWYGVVPGVASGAQLVTALNNAFAAPCIFQTLFLPPTPLTAIVFGSTSGVNQPANCAVAGDPISGTTFEFQNAIVGSTAWTIHPSTFYVGGGLSDVIIVGSTNGVPTDSKVTLGLRIANVGYFQLRNVNVETINGPCVSIGFGVQNTFTNLAASLCNPSSTQANVMVDGRSDGFGGGTTTLFTNISAGSDANFGSGYGLMLDNYVTTQFYGGAVESTPKIACIGCAADAAQVANVVFTGVDFEEPTTSGTSILTLNGTSSIVGNIRLLNNSFASSNAVNGVLAQSTTTLYGSGNSFDMQLTGAVFYNIAGTGNTGTEIDTTGPSVSAAGYKIAVVNGVLANATLNLPWNLDSDFPTTIAPGYPVFPACGPTFATQTRHVTDSNTPYSSAALGTTPTGGGSNLNGLVCDGTAWKIALPF